MNTNTTQINYFRTPVHVGVHQKVGRHNILELPGGMLLWKTTGKLLLWALPVLLCGNLLLASMINTRITMVGEAHQSVEAQQVINQELVKSRDRLVSPVRVKLAAAEKLSLHEAVPGQIHRM